MSPKPQVHSSKANPSLLSSKANPSLLKMTKQVLPDWSPTGQPKRQGNAASRNSPDFSETGQPGSHGGGAARNLQSCPLVDIPLTVLAPVTANYGGHTTQATPSLWVYVPFALNANNPVTFSLLDNNYNPLYDSFQVIDHGPGILKFSLPDEVVLEPEQVYRWFFMVHCDDPLGIRTPLMVEGWVRRVADPLPESENDNLLLPEQRIERSNQYANRLVWYDALNLLGEGLLEQPDNPQLIPCLDELLGYPSVQLQELSSVPLRDCCVLQEHQDALN
ncbi:MAG: DUF928 domain-containing protein [Cyanothece sp. SIO2G6]|nr:DUF928 domain-containing protein [Cyanothece sp. SIO2G6]